jgi:hypothetical protein
LRSCRLALLGALPPDVTSHPSCRKQKRTERNKKGSD